MGRVTSRHFPVTAFAACDLYVLDSSAAHSLVTELQQVCFACAW